MRLRWIGLAALLLAMPAQAQQANIYWQTLPTGVNRFSPVSTGNPLPVTCISGCSGGGGGTQEVQGQVNVTPNNCSGTITAGGTAQNAFTASATKHGFTIMNLSTEDLWISFTTTAAPSTVASYLLNASATGAAGGSYSAPFGFGMNTALSVVGATTGNKYSCTWW